MIKLTDNIYLDADETCFNLIIWDGSIRIKDGKEFRSNARYRYYNTLESTIQGLHKMLSRQAVYNANTLDDLMKSYSCIENSISKMLISKDTEPTPPIG